MKLEYEGWSRRIDLALRAKYPYLRTKIFKKNNHEFLIYVENIEDRFDEIAKDFNRSIRYITAPVKLVDTEPSDYEKLIHGISDEEIPSNFEGLPFTIYQLSNHVECMHPGQLVSKVIENHSERQIVVEVIGEVSEENISAIQLTLNNLKGPYEFKVKGGGRHKEVKFPSNMVFEIASATSQKKLKAKYIERDEELWFGHVEDIYKKQFKKDDLYFYDSDKTSCLVNFSTFQNSNIRNHLLLYDIIYCVLPLREDMLPFLESQKISRADILNLVENGRLKILNTQPEIRLDYGFINEAYETDPTSVVSRRAISTLCAIDLVDINSSYIFSNPELQNIIYPFLRETSFANGQNFNNLIKFLFWPQTALRNSFDALNSSGPKGIARYGVNTSITESFSGEEKEKIAFEFVVNSEPIHLAHALDATYFPFFTKNSQYTDHPFALMMGNLLNFYKTANVDHIKETFKDLCRKEAGNPSIQLVTIFDINEYISISEFEKEVSSSVIRRGLHSLFGELSTLNDEERRIRISSYNKGVEDALSGRKVVKHVLDLGEDAVGVFVPFIASGKKIGSWIKEKSVKNLPLARKISEYLANKLSPNDENKRNISLLTKINRVARLRQKYDR